MNKRGRKIARLMSLVVLAGTGYQLAGCGDIASYLGKINPCGTALNCDPITYRFIRSGYRGPGADPTVDPACTYPPFCNRTTPGSDPFSPP